MPTVTDLPDLFTVADLVARYELSENAVLEWIGSGELVAFKLGRRWFVHADDWSAFVEGRRRAALGDED